MFHLLLSTGWAGTVQLPPPSATDRFVTLGDSITDGFTYGQILIQAIREGGKPVPAIICGGRSSDTSLQMAARLDETVLVFHPQWVTFSAGTNDALRGVTDEQYEQALREIVHKVQAQGGRLVLLTPCEIIRREGKSDQEKEDNHKMTEARLDSLEAIIRKVAADTDCPVAENRAGMSRAIGCGESIFSADGIHPNYAGQAIIARSILDAIGYAKVALPTSFAPRLFPCAIRSWKMRLAPLDKTGHPIPITDKTIGSIVPDASWKTYTLPDAPTAGAPSAEKWEEQLRRNGFALDMQAKIGSGAIEAVTDIESAKQKTAYLQIGIGANTVWLNGVKVHEQGSAWTGFHAGKERIEVHLRAGVNHLVAETGGPYFFLGISDEMVWESQL